MRRLTILISLAAFGWLAADARACSCVGPDMVLADAERVFVGTVVDRRTTKAHMGDPVEAVYTFAVERVVRGEVPERVELRAGTQEASCGIDLPVGRRVAVMLTQAGDEVNLCQVVEPAEVGADPVAPAVTALLGQVLNACAQAARWTFSAAR